MCVCVCVCVCVKLLQSCLTLCNPMNYSPPNSSVHGILQARILDWVAISYSRESSPPRDQTCISYISFIGRYALSHQHHREAHFLIYRASKRYLPYILFQDIRGLPKLVNKPPYQFPIGDVTNYHKLSGLKQQKIIILLQFQKLEVLNSKCRQSSVPLGSLRENLSPCFQILEAT